MPRTRTNKKNKQLPKHWTWHHGSIYYVVPVSKRDRFDNSKIRLGKTLQEAHRSFSEMLDAHEDHDIVTINDLVDRYQLETLPKNAHGTQENKRRSFSYIRAGLGSWPIDVIEPHHVYSFHATREKQSGNRSARGDIEVLRHLYTKAVEWGVVKRHPFKGEIQIAKNPPRDRYVTDQELSLFLQCYATPKIRAYVKLKMLTGLAKQDLLCLRLEDIQQDGLHAHRRKTKSKQKIYQWDDDGELLAAIDEIKLNHSKNHIGSMWLFHTAKGKGYYPVSADGSAAGKPSGFNSIWQRCMKKYKEDGNEGFSEHDLRAKVASDNDLSHAQELMDHAQPEITERIYRRAPKTIGISTKIEHLSIEKTKNKTQQPK